MIDTHSPIPTISVLPLAIIPKAFPFEVALAALKRIEIRAAETAAGHSPETLTAIPDTDAAPVRWEHGGINE